MVHMVLTYVGAMLVGLVHGWEPGHGWPVAALYSVNSSRQYATGFASAGIISLMHFLSSLAVVLVYYLAGSVIDLSQPWFRYAAAALLVLVAIWTLRGHSHTELNEPKSMWSIAAIGFTMGFAHEEEFVLLALFLGGGIDPWLGMVVYASAVTFSIVTATLASIASFRAMRERMEEYEHLIPKVSAAILILLAAAFALGFY